MFDPIVKSGSEKLTASDVREYLERRRSLEGLDELYPCHWRECWPLEGPAQHTGKRSDFEARGDRGRTPVRFR